jgi:cytochrome b561
MRAPVERYHLVAIILHWVIALGILALIALGLDPSGSGAPGEVPAVPAA